MLDFFCPGIPGKAQSVPTGHYVPWGIPGKKSPARDTFISDVDRGMSSFDIPLDLEVILTELNRLIGSTLYIVDSECV